MARQIVAEIVTDAVCVKYETHKFDLIRAWRKVSALPFFVFLGYGYCAMGITAMVYTNMRLPR
jgi:hypothetical protein